MWPFENQPIVLLSVCMANSFFPFFSLGFHCNPFRTLTDEEWAEIAVIPSYVQQKLVVGYENLQVLGEKGYGKTTILLSIAAEKRHHGRRIAYEYIPEDGRTFQTPLDNLDDFFLDEAQRLEKKERKRLLTHPNAPSLVIASHEDLASLFAAYGRSLTTIKLGQTELAHLQAVLNRRLAYSSLTEHPPFTFTDEAVQQLWDKFGRNIRATEHYLYEYFQQLLVDDKKNSNWFKLPE
ncbi:MAG: hypothetical protein WAM60_23785 [Candidatus Promineifilaceae bacterium]